MKINTCKVVANFQNDFSDILNGIRDAKNYTMARERMFGAIGFLDGISSFLNAIISKEHNEFTGDMGAVVERWMGDIYCTMAEKAKELEQDDDVYFDLLKKRDEHYELAREMNEE